MERCGRFGVGERDTTHRRENFMLSLKPACFFFVVVRGRRARSKVLGQAHGAGRLPFVVWPFSLSPGSLYRTRRIRKAESTLDSQATKVTNSDLGLLLAPFFTPQSTKMNAQQWVNEQFPLRYLLHQFQGQTIQSKEERSLTRTTLLLELFHPNAL